MSTITWLYRGGVTARAVAAIGGGYVLAALGGALIALALPLPRADAVTIATLLAFVIYPCVILWVFATRSALHACVGVAVMCAKLWMILWLVGGTA